MTGPRPSVLVLVPEPLGRDATTGPARRAVKLAEALGEHCDVTLAAPAPSELPAGPFATVQTAPGGDRGLWAAMAAHDVTVTQLLHSPRQLLAARRHARRLVVDVIAPLALEADQIGRSTTGADPVVRWRARELVAHLAVADLVLCTNERQRDLLVGVQLGGGLLGGPGPAAPADRIAVVPHGLDLRRTAPGPGPLRSSAGFGAQERIAVWGGGLWSWLDPLTAVRAVERLAGRRPDVRLAFVGFEHPDPAHRRAHAAVLERVRAHVRERRLEDTVAFLPRWLAREDFVAHLADADVGVSLHGPVLEGRYASRTRVVDYLEAGLAVLCSSGDAMSDLVARHGLGEVVEPLDVDGCAAALERLTAAPGRPVAREVLDALRWPAVVRPLVEFCVAGAPPAPRSPARELVTAARSYPAFLHAARSDAGLAALGRAARRRAGSFARARP